MIYVDNARKPYKGMLMNHIIADTKIELLHLIRKLGMHTKWIQFEGTYKEHFDICSSKRLKAIDTYGAIPIETRELVKIMLKRKTI